MNKINNSEKRRQSDVLDDQYISDLLESTKKRTYVPRRSTKKLEKVVSSPTLFQIEIIIFLNKTRHELKSYGYYAEPLHNINDSLKPLMSS